MERAREPERLGPRADVSLVERQREQLAEIDVAEERRVQAENRRNRPGKDGWWA